MRFTCTIELGSNGIETPQDLAAALEVLAQHLPQYGQQLTQCSGKLHDGNGRAVGTWGFFEPPPSHD